MLYLNSEYFTKFQRAALLENGPFIKIINILNNVKILQNNPDPTC